MFYQRVPRVEISATGHSIRQFLLALSRNRKASVSTVATQSFGSSLPPPKSTGIPAPERPFQRLSTPSLIRGVLLGQIFTSPLLYRPGLYLLEGLARSKSALLDPDRNPILGALILPLFYRHLCAGRNATEVKRTIAEMRKVGYSGVILCFSGEIIDAGNVKTGRIDNGNVHAVDKMQKEIDGWKEFQLKTLEAVGEGNYIGVKYRYTGAGSDISEALKHGRPPPSAMVEAMHAVCDRAQQQKTQLWIDAEQQVYHPAIDNWTIDLMRKYNRDGNVLVLATVQAYLKTSRQTVERYLRLAQAEGWTLGIKLVRGAYIGSEIRSRIHDTKMDTDESYNGIAHDLIRKHWPGLAQQPFPDLQLFLAGHNTASIRKAYTLVQDLAARGEIASHQQIRYGQSQGIADDVGCELLALRDQIERSRGYDQQDGNTIAPGEKRDGHDAPALAAAPAVYKCLIWGSLKQCLHFLVRRAVENHGAVERLNKSLPEMRRELRWRILRF